MTGNSHMRISEVEREVTDITVKYGAYGVDAILKAIARASLQQPCITEDYVLVLVRNAFGSIKEAD